MGVLDFHSGHSSPSAIEMEENEAFRRVNSGKSSGENKPFSF